MYRLYGADFKLQAFKKYIHLMIQSREILFDSLYYMLAVCCLRKFT